MASLVATDEGANELSYNYELLMASGYGNLNGWML